MKIGAVLVELQEIAAVLVENGKVGGDDDLFRRDRSMISEDFAGSEFQKLGVFKNPQVPGDGRDEIEREASFWTKTSYPC